jgi:hypothetical protein
MSNTENEYECEIDGIEYVAIDQDACEGCVCDSDILGELCRKLPNCLPAVIKNGSSRIWVKK